MTVACNTRAKLCNYASREKYKILTNSAKSEQIGLSCMSKFSFHVSFKLRLLKRELSSFENSGQPLEAGQSPCAPED